MKINIGEATSVEDVLNWDRSGASEVTFHISRASEFALFAEGPALGKIRDFRLRNVAIRAEASFPLILTADDHRSFGILWSVFGISLLSNAISLVDGSGNEVRLSALEILWKSIQGNGGQFGDGAKRSVLIRDPDYSLPQCLRENQQRRFPFLEAFSRLVRTFGREMSGKNGFGDSLAESDVITFLYEAALNAHEHGRLSAREGVRGIFAEKFIFASDADLLRRARIPGLLKDGLRGFYGDGARQRIVIAFTVADVGPGIHETLPPKLGESAWERLNRAFGSGESRKAPSSDARRGEGTVKMLTAARNLNAFLLVQSAGLLAYCDLSAQRSATDELLLSPWPNSFGPSIGTSLTLVWPITKSNPDQRPLFPAEKS